MLIFSPSRLLVNWDDYNLRFYFLLFQSMWASNDLVCLFKCLVYFCLPGFFWSSLILHFPLQTMRGPHSLLCPQHLVECMPRSGFPQVPLFGSLNYFAHQVPCREQEYHFGGVQVWTTFHEVVLRVGSRGICSGAHQRPGYCLPIAFPAMVTSLRWGWGVFGDVRKGSFLNTLFLGSIFRERLLGWGNELFPGFLRFPWSHCLRRGVGLFTQRCGRGVSTDYKVSTYLGCVSTWDWHLLFWGAFSGG